MARRSLKPQLNQIRTWVRQGRTDAWIAHQLEVSVKDIAAFKREQGLVPPEADGDGESFPAPAQEEPDLRAEDEALVAAALEAEQAAGPHPARARGDVRPRRRGLWAMARPGGAGRPGVRGALGGPPAGHGGHRARPDRDHARRRGA